MTNGANGKVFSRLVAVVFMGLAFAGCAMMLTTGNQSLFADSRHYAATVQAAVE